VARQLLVLEEVIAMLQTISAPNRVIDQFRKQAEFVLDHRPQPKHDDVQVGSIFGAASRRGGVNLSVNDTQTQMDTKKAREIGLMLIEAAEAAESDEVFMKFLEEKVGITDAEKVQAMLLDLRELRQGSRGTVYPQ
jgi:hypothetical protein